MHSAFSIPTSVESMTNTFTIRHQCATKENVLMLVRCMYEKWLPDIMDSHAIELVQIADCYECLAIARRAAKSLIR